MSNPSRNIPSNISITGDVSNSAVVLGNDNNVTINVEYRPFVDKFLGRMADLTEHFVGREFLDCELEKFLESNECGYFTLIGEPGIGKSAWAAHIIQTQKAVYHFCEPGHEITNTLSNLAVQISQLFNIPAEFPPSSAPAFAQYFSKVIYEASLQLERKLVIVIDSLDQLDVSAINTGANVLLLPESLPKGVFIVTTTRPPAPHLIVAPEVTKAQYIISGSDQANQADAMQFIREKLTSEPYAQHIQSQNISIDEFANALLEQSAGNFMYLRAQFIALKDPARFAAGIAGLPLGLHKYYEQFWHALEHEIHDEKVWEETKSIFGLLAVAYDSVDADWIGAVSKQESKQVIRIFDKHIAEFLSRESKEKKSFWKIYHQSFRDFISKELQDLTPYHRQIAEYYRSVDFSTASIKEVAYGVRNFVKHLEILGEKDEIYRLVIADEKQPLWVNAHYALSGEYSGYLRDLNKAWAIAENKEAWDFGRQLHCSVIQASVQSLSANIPLPLMIQAIKHKFWTPEVAIEYIKAFPANAAKRISVLFELEPYLEIEKQPLWGLAWEWAFHTFDENEQGKAFRELFPFVNEKGESFILEHLSKFMDSHVRIENLVALYPKARERDRTKVNDWLWQSLVEIKEKKDEETLKSFLEVSSVHPMRQAALSSWRDRVELLTDSTKKVDWLSQSVSLYEAEERKNLVSELLLATEKVWDTNLNSKILQRLAPFLSNIEAQKAVEIVRGIKEVEKRNKSLEILAKSVPESSKKYVLDEILAIKDLNIRLGLLAEIFDSLPKELWGLVQEQFTFSASKPKTLVETLPALTKKLPEEHRIWAFELAKQIKPENIRAELLARITLLLPLDFLSHGLEEINKIQSDEHYFKAIGRLICFTPVEYEQQIIESIQKKYEKQSLKYFVKTGDQNLRTKEIIWFLIDYFGKSRDVELTLLWRSPRRVNWEIRMDNYKEKEYSRFVFTQYLREEQSQLFKVLDELQDSDRVVLLQAIIWSTQNFGPYFHTLDWTLGKYKRIKRKKHLRPFFNSWIGVRFDLFSLGRLIRIEDDNTSFDARLINARTWQDFVKAFILPWFQYPKLPKPLVLYAALQVISVKPTKRWWGIEAVNKIWRRMKYVGVRKEKKIWSEVIRTLSAHGFNEFREDLDHFAPLFIEVGGQKAIQETYEALRDIKTWWAQSD